MPLFNPKTRIKNLLIGACLAVSTSTVIAADAAKTSHDGLELIKQTKSRLVYLKPGASFDQYKKVAVLDLYIAFKKNWKREKNRTSNLDGHVSKKDMDTIKDRLNKHFRKQFISQLEKDGFELSEVTGNDVLIIRPAIIDLDVNAPDLMTAGMNDNLVRSAGSMKLYAELIDSETNALIARVLDAEAGRDWGTFYRATRVTNGRDADEIIRKWADMLAEGIKKAQEK